MVVLAFNDFTTKPLRSTADRLILPVMLSFIHPIFLNEPLILLKSICFPSNHAVVAFIESLSSLNLPLFILIFPKLMFHVLPALCALSFTGAELVMLSFFPVYSKIEKYGSFRTRLLTSMVLSEILILSASISSPPIFTVISLPTHASTLLKATFFITTFLRSNFIPELFFVLVSEEVTYFSRK